MLNDLLKNHLLKVIITVLLLLLACAFLLKEEFVPSEKDSNRYYKALPSKYIEIIESSVENDSTFFCLIRKNNGLPELIILKVFPNKAQLAVDFSLQLYPKESIGPINDKGFFTELLDNDATLYNYNGKMYGVFRKPLPLINLERVAISEKPRYKKQKTWKKVIERPYEINKNLDQNKLTSKVYKSKQPTNAYDDVFTKILEDNNISALPYSFSVKNDSLYKVSADFEDYVDNENLTIGVIKNQNVFWRNLNTKQKQLSGDIKIIGVEQDKVLLMLSEYGDGLRSLEKLIDLNKLSKFFAFKQLFSRKCGEDFYLKYNKETNLLEPFHVDSKCLGSISKYVSSPDIDDINFITTHIETLKQVSELDISEYINTINPELESYLTLHNSFYPQSIFDIDILAINQRIIQKSLDQNSLVKSELLSFKKGKLVVTIQNIGSYPVRIKELSHKGNKTITSIDGFRQIPRGSKDTITIVLPRSFENLFVNKKKKTTEFILYKHIGELFLGYSIIGMDELAYSNIIPYQEKEAIDDDLFRKEVLLENDKNIIVDNVNKVISFSQMKTTIDYPLIIPSGFVFEAKPNTQIDIVKGGKIISHSPLSFLGKNKEDIKVFSSDKKGQGIIVFSEGINSELKFVKFLDLTNPKHGNWNVTGAVTFYESPVKMTNVIIENNRCEDALNIVRTTFEMRYCRISNTQSDAFDGDFVTGNIVDCSFDNLGNDAIDVSGSDLKIIRVKITNAGDKGLSAGENSRMTVRGVEISNSEIAVAGKDLSTVTIDKMKVENTKLGFTAFQKKPEYGPSNIKVNDLVMNLVETNYLIETTSSLMVDGKKIETAQNVKDRMYGVEFGRSSAETRNSQ
jgi:hypothetical protein